MRETKFRGMDEKGIWHYGFLVDVSALDDKQSAIRIYEQLKDGGVYHPVKKETVGEYVGLKDKNGKEIYENDVLRWLTKECKTGKIINDSNCSVEWNDGRWVCILNNYLEPLFQSRIKYLEVVGNIYEYDKCYR